MASTFEKGDLLLSVAISYVHDFQDAPISLLICIFIPFEGKILQQLMLYLVCAIFPSNPTQPTQLVNNLALAINLIQVPWFTK